MKTSSSLIVSLQLDDLVSYAWGSGAISWWENPGLASAQWPEHVIGSAGTYPGVVDTDWVDVDGDGLHDLLLAWDCNIPPQVGGFDARLWNECVICDNRTD